jgi:hypothetical protein
MSLGAWLRQWALPFNADNIDSSPLLSEARFIVLDVDVTGVDIRKDRATGMAMLPLERGRFRIADIAWFPFRPSAHRTEASESLRHDQYLSLVAAAAANTVVTYNTRFVRRMIKHAADANDLPLPFGHWVDLRTILEGTIGREIGEVLSLQDWQERTGMDIVDGYSATADVFAMAQLLEIAFAYCEDRGITTLDGLIGEQKSRTWLRGGDV